MSVFFLFFLSGCSFFSEDTITEEVIAIETPTSAEFSQQVDMIVQEVRELWKQDTAKKKREAQKILMKFYQQDAQFVFARLHREHATEVMAAEHQLGWVIHRLGRHTSRSFTREGGYLEKLTRKLKTCGSFLPEKKPAEISPEEGGEAISKSAI